MEPIIEKEALDLKVFHLVFLVLYISNDFLCPYPQALCPMQVFDIEDIVVGGELGMEESRLVPSAVVARPRDCTMCRECVRDPEKNPFGRKIELRRKADHFIFSVESTGCMEPEIIVREVFCPICASSHRAFILT